MSYQDPDLLMAMLVRGRRWVLISLNSWNCFSCDSLSLICSSGGREGRREKGREGGREGERERERGRDGGGLFNGEQAWFRKQLWVATGCLSKLGCIYNVREAGEDRRGIARGEGIDSETEEREV